MLVDYNPVPLNTATKNILVVDDEPGILVLIQAVLETNGQRCLVAKDAATALSLLQRDDVQIDLLLTDVVMPDINGAELAMRALLLRPSLRVLFMSAFAQTDVLRMRILDHTLAMVEKPFTSTELLGQINEALAAPSWPPLREPRTIAAYRTAVAGER